MQPTARTVAAYRPYGCRLLRADELGREPCEMGPASEVLGVGVGVGVGVGLVLGLGLGLGIVLGLAVCCDTT